MFTEISESSPHSFPPFIFLRNKEYTYDTNFLKENIETKDKNPKVTSTNHKRSEYLFRIPGDRPHNILKVARSDLFCIPSCCLNNTPTQSGRTSISWQAGGFFSKPPSLTSSHCLEQNIPVNISAIFCWNFYYKREILWKVSFCL